MALATYSDLQTAILEWRGRPGDTTYSNRAADFIALFEAKIRRRFRFRQMVQTSALTINAKLVALPADYLQVMNVRLLTNPTRDLRAADVNFLEMTYDDNALARPAYYAVVGSNLQFGPAPDMSYSGSLLYYSFTALVSGVNWLMTNYPDVYLFGALIEGAAWEQDAQSAIIYKAKLDEAMAELEVADMNAIVSSDTAAHPDIQVF